MADHILIGDIEPRISYAVGATPRTVFEVPFPFFADSDLAVYVDGERKTVATDYSVAGAGVSAGGSVTFNVVQANCVVAIVRDVPIARTTDFPTSGPFQIPALNTGLDRLTAWIQEQRSRLDRCLRPPDSDPDGVFSLPPAVVRANRYFGFDGDGNPAVMVDATGYPASVYGSGLIAAANAAAARGLLGFTTAGANLVTAADVPAQRVLLSSLTHFAAGAALPTSNIGPIWHADYASIMTWQVFSANGAAYTGYASVDIGNLQTLGQSTAKPGTVKANGADLSTTTYAALYGWAKHNGLVVASGDWTAGTLMYRENGGGTFRTPDPRGVFFRAWSDGSSVDSGRAHGSAEADAFQTHTHSSAVVVAGAVQAGGAAIAVTAGNTGAATGRTAAETRPVNVAALVAIKF